MDELEKKIIIALDKKIEKLESIKQNIKQEIEADFFEISILADQLNLQWVFWSRKIRKINNIIRKNHNSDLDSDEDEL
jgi:hypothetical protein